VNFYGKDNLGDFMAHEEVELAWGDRLRALWSTLVGGVGLAMGLVPHILHHVGFLAGTALVAGTGGVVLFGALGFLFSVPMLLRLRRRFGTWRAPAIGLLIFAVMFSLSAFVVGPVISGADDTAPSPNVHTEDH